jgi:hypothetical protein
MVERTGSAPRARSKGLVIKELPDEVLVYDLTSDTAHCLNRTAALVWKGCDGRSAPAEIARQVSRELEMPVSEETVWRTLGQLQDDDLLEETAAAVTALQDRGMSRRQVIMALGAATVALPVITSLTATAAYAAGSCGGSCTSATICTNHQTFCQKCLKSGGNGNCGTGDTGCFCSRG